MIGEEVEKVEEEEEEGKLNCKSFKRFSFLIPFTNLSYSSLNLSFFSFFALYKKIVLKKKKKKKKEEKKKKRGKKREKEGKREKEDTIPIC